MGLKPGVTVGQIGEGLVMVTHIRIFLHHRREPCLSRLVVLRTSMLAARYHGDFKKLLEYLGSNVRLTHRDPFVAGRSMAFGLIVAALINGDT